ncbi:polysaccharide deacetylase family protein [Streptomyces sp. BA2]|uniref:polysaccharide deacetylase family protein n=1 Tax=Streptomyces sp. BA2 TaxID=436595 RepID=UPI00132282B5|nr:polysaccharide deacetylase family protein [Streptomyces sp. BA2]MWA13021.1 polysaccharide deacetylase family protein [Streptomyces sp. BA2]
MQLVRQNVKYGRRRTRHVRAAVAALVVAAIASGCASGDDGGASPAPGQQRLDAPPARALDSYAHKLRVTQVARAAAAKRWGLAKTPLAAPPAPAKKPKITTRKGFEVKGQAGLPPVFTTIPTKKKIVFLTIDDGAEKDPALLKMMSELQIPYTAFLSDYLVKEDYGYFKKMQSRGVVLNNHTLNHRYMPGLSYASQRREICGMQDTIQKRYGKRPELFRPPYGNYNADTLRAAKSCGIKAVPLWASEAFPNRMDWREWDRDLHPGDIILTHFRGREDWKGTMPDMIRKVMKTVTDKGYAVARLEDYL